MNFNYFLFSLVCLCFLSGCKKDIEIGGDLLSDQELNLEFTDDINISAKTIESEPLPSYFKSSDGGDNASTFYFGRTFMIGAIDEPYFGKSEAILYANASVTFTKPDFEGAVFDSCVLVIPYDTLGQYGEINTPQNIEVYQLDNSLLDLTEEMDTIFSDQSYPFQNLIGSTTITPNYIDSFELDIPQGDTIITGNFPQQFRVSLDPSFGEQLMDTLIQASDSTFQEFFKGIAIKTDGATNGLLGLRMDRDAGANVSLFFTIGDSSYQRQSFPIGNIRHNEFIHDYSGTEVESAIADPQGAEYMFLQSMGGTNISFDISSVAQFEDELINKFELEVTIADLMDFDQELYPPHQNIYISYYNEDSILTEITDVKEILGDFLGISTVDDSSIIEQISIFFGGELEEDETNVELKKYKFNITNHLKKYIDGEISNPEIILTAYNKVQNPYRTILFGPNHPDNDLRAKLKLIVTEQ